MSTEDFVEEEQKKSPEKTEEEMEREIALIDEMFPDAQFSIAIDLEEMDDVLTELSSIVVKNTYTCYCYDGHIIPTDYFHISTTTSRPKMTVKYVLEQLISQGLSLECNHCFVEGFVLTNASACQFEIATGS